MDPKHGECLTWYLKIWMDRYGFLGEIKGGHCSPNFDKFIITSNYHPKEVFSNYVDLEAILRRLDLIHVPLKLF